MDHPEVINYLDQNKIDKYQVSWMATTKNGIIVDVGSVGDLLLVAPLIGENAEDFIPALVGLFPVVENCYLPNIQVLANRYHSLHLLVSGSKVWVLFQDVSNKVAAFRTHAALCANEMSLLEGLDYWVLKQEDGHKFLPVGRPPVWLNELVSEPERIPEIDELFPFLITFLEQLPPVRGLRWRRGRCGLRGR